MTFLNAEASSSASAATDGFPLQLALAFILVRAFPQTPVHQSTLSYSPSFVSSILALVAREELELRDAPVTSAALEKEVDQILKPEVQAIRRLNDKVRSRGQVVGPDREAAEHDEGWMSSFAASFQNIPDGCSFLDYLEREIRDRVNDLDDDDVTETPHPFERRSPLGVFLRRIMTRLRKLSFAETGHLAVQVGLWCGNPEPRGGHSGAINRRAALESTSQTRQEAMDSINRATESGDYTAALSSLRRFYDYKFPGSGRGRHQHALLNIATFHFSTHGMEMAKTAVEEAIRVARAEGDRPCLNACIRLSNRIEAKLADDSASGGRLIVEDRLTVDGSIPLPSDPMEELWALQAALGKGEPTHVAMRRIQLALGRYEFTKPYAEDKHSRGWSADHPFDEAAWHQSQAALWASIGSNTLSELHEDMAAGCEGGSPETRLIHVIANVQRLAGRGDFERAISLLLNFDMLKGMSHAAYERWETALWSLVGQQVALSGDDQALDILEKLHATASQKFKGVVDQVRASLRQAEKMVASHAPAHLVMPQILSAMHLAHELGLWPLYRHSVVVFAEVLLSMEDQAMARKVIEEVERIWPELASSGDEETIARGALVLGKAMVHISMDEDHPDLLAHAMSHLDTAQTSAERISAQCLLKDIHDLMDGVSQLAGERMNDHTPVPREVSTVLSDRIRSIGEIVKLASVRVSENWS